jgi:hypothetical protein
MFGPGLSWIGWIWDGGLRSEVIHAQNGIRTFNQVGVNGEERHEWHNWYRHRPFVFEREISRFYIQIPLCANAQSLFVTRNKDRKPICSVRYEK